MSPTSDSTDTPPAPPSSGTTDADEPLDLVGQRTPGAVIHEPGISRGAVIAVIAFALAAAVMVYRSMSAAFDDVRNARIVLPTLEPATGDDVPVADDPGIASVPDVAPADPSPPGPASAFLLDRVLMESSAAPELLGAVPTLVQLRPRRELLLDTGVVLVEGQLLGTGAELVAIESDRLLVRSDGQELEIALR